LLLVCATSGVELPLPPHLSTCVLHGAVVGVRFGF